MAQLLTIFQRAVLIFKSFADMKSIYVLLLLSVTSLQVEAQRNYDTLMARGYRFLEAGNTDSANFIAIEASVYYEHLVQSHLFKAEVDFTNLDAIIKKNKNDEKFETAQSAEWARGMEAVFKAFEIEPNNSAVRYYRAWGFLLANNTDSAKADIEVALKAEPANSSMLQLKQVIAEAPEKIRQKYKTPEAKSRLCISLGLTYGYFNQWIAYNYYEEALKHNSRNTTTLLYQAYILSSSEFYKHALEKLNAGLRVDSNNIYLKNEKYQVKLHYDPSRTDLKEVPNKSRDAEFIKFKNELANICGDWLTHFSKKQYDSATLLITDCMMSPGTSISASFNNRGVAYYHFKKQDAAISDLKKAILLGGVYNNGSAEYWLAKIYYEQGKKELAENIIKEAIPLYPQNKMFAELQKQFGGSTSVQQQNTVPKPAVQKQPTTASDFYREALLAKNNKDYNKALIHFNTSLQMDGGNDSCLFDRGLLYYEMKAYSLASKDFTDAALLNFTDSKYYLYIAVAQYAQGNYQSSISRLNSVITMDAANGNAYRLRSMAYCKTGNAAQAAEDAKKAASNKMPLDMSCTQMLSYDNQQMADSKKESVNGIALLAAKKEDEAAAAFKKAIEKWSGNQDAYFHLAALHEKYRMGHVADAYMKQLEYLNPNYPGAQKLAISIAVLKGLQ